MSRELLERALEALEASMKMMDQWSYRRTMEGREGFNTLRVIIDIREHLARTKEPENRFGKETPCKDHPDAPHGFDRNQTQTEGVYVCDCKYWEPDNDHAR